MSLRWSDFGEYGDYGYWWVTPHKYPLIPITTLTQEMSFWAKWNEVEESPRYVLVVCGLYIRRSLDRLGMTYYTNIHASQRPYFSLFTFHLSLYPSPHNYPIYNHAGARARSEQNLSFDLKNHSFCQNPAAKIFAKMLAIRHLFPIFVSTLKQNKLTICT